MKPSAGGPGAAFTDYGRRLRAKLARHARVLSSELIGQVRLVYQALCDPSTPSRAKLMLAAALAYFILPTDALPDFLPALGFTDDAAVLGLALRSLQEILRVQRMRLSESDTAVQAGQALHDLRIELATLQEELVRARHETRKWRGLARAMTFLVVFLALLLIGVILRGG